MSRAVFLSHLDEYSRHFGHLDSVTVSGSQWTLPLWDWSLWTRSLRTCLLSAAVSEERLLKLQYVLKEDTVAIRFSTLLITLVTAHSHNKQNECIFKTCVMTMCITALASLAPTVQLTMATPPTVLALQLHQSLDTTRKPGLQHCNHYTQSTGTFTLKYTLLKHPHTFPPHSSHRNSGVQMSCVSQTLPIFPFQTI